ncbi:pentatricopeptide repeat-containing protein At2g41720-like [Carica papaya]|uniref:pentatricopeptide repeat-containing protein At2g41720-like n=1 Tax=Carica papaya TaxID=3649 RepID=UPI000B8C8C8D|nr:pentatricopeptide repeat-containing protein At2g41720-like [Carica papaya]
MATVAPPALLKPLIPSESTRPNTESTRRTLIICKNHNNTAAFEEKKSVLVDYDKGQHEVSTRVSGLRKAEIPRRYRLRVQGHRFQMDWTISEVVERLMELNHWEDVEAVLNRWIGRFARKNFPILIRGLY